MQFTCDDKTTLVSYLYGELDAQTRRAVDDHLARCAACAAELTALGAVRSELGLWAAPDVELDFAIVKKSQLPASNVVRPARWWTTVPAWAQAAAAILVVAAGASIANLQITSGPDGFSVTTGWMQRSGERAMVAAGPAVQVQGAAANDEVKAQLAALEQKLRDEIRAGREQNVTRVAATGGDPVTLRRVEQMIADAEHRHSRELAARFVEFNNDLTMQRRADMMNIQRVINAQDAQMFRQRQMLNNAIRVSATPQQ
jgi:anti-sigma factor RsiW